MLMAGEARGAEPGERPPMKMDAVREGAGAGETRAKAIELALTHQLVTKYASLHRPIDRTPARAAPRPSRGRGRRRSTKAICLKPRTMQRRYSLEGSGGFS